MHDQKKGVFMNLLRYVFVLWALSFVIIPQSFAKVNLEPAIQKTIVEIEEKLQQPIGAAIAIIYKGKVVHMKTYGHEYQGGSAITKDTYFALGSSTKPIAALVISDLIKKSGLNFDISMVDYVPKLPKGIKLKHVLDHTTGYTYKGNSDIERGLERTEVLANLFKSKPENSPGKKFLYNNVTYSLLENLSEKLTGKTWRECFYEGLAARGLGHIEIIAPKDNEPVAHPHHFDKEKGTLKDLGRLRKNYPRVVSSAAGGYASIEDLARFVKLQLSSEFDSFQEPQVDAPDLFYWGIKFPRPQNKVKSSYAYGWRILELKDDPDHLTRLTFHGGWIKGVAAFIGMMKEHDLAIVVLSNDDRGIPFQSGMKLWENILNAVDGNAQ